LPQHRSTPQPPLRSHEQRQAEDQQPQSQHLKRQRDEEGTQHDTPSSRLRRPPSGSVSVQRAQQLAAQAVRTPLARTPSGLSTPPRPPMARPRVPVPPGSESFDAIKAQHDEAASSRVPERPCPPPPGRPRRLPTTGCGDSLHSLGTPDNDADEAGPDDGGWQTVGRDGKPLRRKRKTPPKNGEGRGAAAASLPATATSRMAAAELKTGNVLLRRRHPARHGSPPPKYRRMASDPIGRAC
jgi:hypothetical protein